MTFEEWHAEYTASRYKGPDYHLADDDMRASWNAGTTEAEEHNKKITEAAVIEASKSLEAVMTQARERAVAEARRQIVEGLTNHNLTQNSVVQKTVEACIEFVKKMPFAALSAITGPRNAPASGQAADGNTPGYDHLHEENDWGVCRICAQRDAKRARETKP